MQKDTKQCPECNAKFTCTPAPIKAGCWCNRYPPITPVDSGQACLCPNCLGKLAGKTIDAQLATLSLEAALTLASIYRNNDTPIEYIDYTLEAGRLVFSRWYHLKRGSCCGNGCRHCPYH